MASRRPRGEGLGRRFIWTLNKALDGPAGLAAYRSDSDGIAQQLIATSRREAGLPAAPETPKHVS